MKRIAALLLVLLMIVTVTGCGGKKRQPIQLTLSTEDAEAIMAAAGIALPPVEEAKGANTVVDWFSWLDLFQNYSEEEIVQTGYYTFQNKYNGSINWIECTYENRNNDLANYLVAGTAPDMTNCGTSNFATFPVNVTRGMYQPIDQWIDYDNDPLWMEMKDAGEYYELGGRHWAIVYDLTFKDIVPYNRRVFDEWGFDDPWELYLNDERTWDVFLEMCLDFNSPDDDRFAVDGYYIVNGLVEESTGHYIIERDEEGHYMSNLDDPIIEAGENLVYELARNDCMYRVGSNYWGLNTYGATYGGRVKDGLCLFWFCDDEGLMMPVEELKQTYGDISEGEVMIAPLPRYQDGDGVYYLNSIPKAFNIINGAKHPDAAVLLAMCTRFKIMDPTVINIDRKQLKEKYLWTEEMLGVWDECNELARENVRMFQTGNLPQNVSDIYNRFDWNIIRSGGATTWAQLKEQNRDSFEYYIEELNAMIDSYVYSSEFTG